MSVLIPWSNVESILKTHGDTLQVIVLALPCKPIVVKTSKLLLSIFPTQGFKGTMNSFLALRMYMVSWHYFRHELEAIHSPHWERIDSRLKSDQTAALEGADTIDNHAFNISYLHAYEVAITKCMHVKRLLLPEFADDEDTHKLTEPILSMDATIVQALGIRDYLTPIAVPTPTAAERSMIDQMVRQQETLQTEMDQVAAEQEAADKRDVSASDDCSTSSAQTNAVTSECSASETTASDASTSTSTSTSTVADGALTEAVASLRIGA